MLDLDRYQNITSYQKHKLVFFAVPKCCGTAVKAALLNQEILNPSSLRYDYVYDHPDALYVTKQYVTEQLVKDAYLPFSVIRHPYIRFASLYKHFVLRDPDRMSELHPDLTPCSIDYFCDYLFDNTDNLTCNHHLKSISSFLMDKNNVNIPDIVFNLDEEYKTLIDFLRSYGCELQAANVSNLDVELNSKIKARIVERYSQDFETYQMRE